MPKYYLDVPFLIKGDVQELSRQNDTKISFDGINKKWFWMGEGELPTFLLRYLDTETVLLSQIKIEIDQMIDALSADIEKEIPSIIDKISNQPSIEHQFTYTKTEILFLSIEKIKGYINKQTIQSAKNTLEHLQSSDPIKIIIGSLTTIYNKKSEAIEKNQKQKIKNDWDNWAESIKKEDIKKINCDFVNHNFKLNKKKVHIKNGHASLLDAKDISASALKVVNAIQAHVDEFVVNTAKYFSVNTILKTGNYDYQVTSKNGDVARATTDDNEVFIYMINDLQIDSESDQAIRIAKEITKEIKR